MRNIINIMVLFCSILYFLTGCKGREVSLPIIPKPVESVFYDKHFAIDQATFLVYNFEKEQFDNISAAFLEYLKVNLGTEIKNIDGTGKIRNNSINIMLSQDSLIPAEGYRIKVSKDKVFLEASTYPGLFYGMQTLLQMLPRSLSKGKVLVNTGEVYDFPRFGWRGLHLDVCRHFMSKEFVLRYLDYMSLHKLNKFHFHLTEDQGWRIEIKKYTGLTETGSVRKETLVGHGRSSDLFDSTPHGGFYTQEEIREIVKYASDRYITVIPEIEMPGHALAALAAYPYLGCTGKGYQVATRWGVFEEIMCAGKENTFEFIEDVLAEVLDLFPSEFIHIGGDEAPKTKWKECPLCQDRIAREGLADEDELQSYFIKRIERFLSANGRKLIGWDEILEGGLASNAAVMSWRGEKGGIEAARMGHYVVMTPGTHCYLDHYQADPETQPLAIGGLTTLEKIYGYEPVPDSLTNEEAHYIMGAQGNVWTEYMKTPEHVEYMVYPRAAALAEVVWSPRRERDYNEFLSRLQSLRFIYDYMGLNYAKVAFDE
ncbi:MAG: beta-N-acetylglucosaminidase [Bacteroidia bacterium]|nr:beta-N-acetylglucosaminidase [Bacteroidia bacterium]